MTVAGLAYLRFAPDPDSVSAPAQAKACDLPLERCGYATEKGSYQADCGTLVVPENRADPESRLIALPVTRIHARSATPPQNATRELLPHLPNGHQVVLSNLGHSEDFWAYGPAASKRLINTFFDSGRVDTSHSGSSTMNPARSSARKPRLRVTRLPSDRISRPL